MFLPFSVDAQPHRVGGQSHTPYDPIMAFFLEPDDPPEVPPLPEERFDRALALRNGLMSEATGGTMHNAHYVLLRSEFLKDPRTKPLLPRFMSSCLSTGDFWQFIKHEFGSYAERREFLREQFAGLIAHVETPTITPVEHIGEGLRAYDAEAVSEAWTKALERAETDPDGAITMARALLETVCLHILEESGLEDQAHPELPKLYRQVSEVLNIAPAQHSEQVFKQILGGAAGIVEGLGALRNRLGDAHGKGRKPAKPAPRHAHLAVNLAGSVALFLTETVVAKKAGQSGGAAPGNPA